MSRRSDFSAGVTYLPADASDLEARVLGLVGSNVLSAVQVVPVHHNT